MDSVERPELCGVGAGSPAIITQHWYSQSWIGRGGTVLNVFWARWWGLGHDRSPGGRAARHRGDRSACSF